MSKDLMADVQDAIERAEDLGTAPVPDDFNDRMLRFAKLANLERQLKTLLDFCKKEMSSLEPDLLEQMGMHGIDRLSVDGLTIFPRSDTYVSKRGDVETADLVAEMRRCGLGYMVSEGYSASSLRAKIKEWANEEIEIPESLASMLNVGVSTRLTTRK